MTSKAPTYCTSCGTEQVSGANFCSNCGCGYAQGVQSNGNLSVEKSEHDIHPKLMKLSSILGSGGLTLVVVSLIWWWASFGESVNVVRSRFNMLDLFQCSYSNSVWCQAFLIEHPVPMPYHPTVLWVGIVCTVVGAILGSTLKR